MELNKWPISYRVRWTDQLDPIFKIVDIIVKNYYKEYNNLFIFLILPHVSSNIIQIKIFSILSLYSPFLSLFFLDTAGIQLDFV